MQNLPAKTGWLWIKEGFALFRKQPAELSTLFLGYMFLMLLLGVIPVVGQLLPLILMPVFSLSFMQASRYIAQGKRVYPNLLLVGWRSPALRSLLLLGVFYAIAAYAAMGLSRLVDGGAFWRVMFQGGLDIQELEGGSMGFGMLVAALVYIPAAMAFWFAAPLMFWQEMPLGKAMFYSFFAVRRSGKAFLVYALSLLQIGVILPAIFGTIVALLFNNTSIIVFILVPLSIILTVVIYCSFYPNYTAVFDQPATDAESTAHEDQAG
ncbi:hypothetical protein FHW67_002327 [Herbaspirillum sp. Sphag1AN]|uniref:BPSS1780 family membrane protein n=1 Tax=unclassified Herbaspirillum TaxID=2624150 RepID=UPI00160788B8|nr:MULTISPECIES: BPSS1780 family membrane protein [unclassified Herbaspirillum]MBB3213039.1 hypothetical protein [Herbaspirillum sp. Sphag1AN]MBB3246236.1 hypothetical protein [Herbaspirillum sp. Sphag64]